MRDRFQAAMRSRAPYSPRRLGVEIAEQTGPLDALRGSRVLVLADAQNLDLSCRDLGYQLSWSRLGQRLRDAAGRASLHAVFCRSGPDDTRRWDYFLERSWQPHAKIARMVKRAYGRIERDSNADFHVAFVGGHLAGRLSVQWVILATGDGTLALDVSACLATLPSTPAVATLSVAGATARTLDARVCKFIRLNIEVGRDVLRPIATNSDLDIER
jgi:hypothetical protein